MKKKGEDDQTNLTLITGLNAVTGCELESLEANFFKFQRKSKLRVFLFHSQSSDETTGNLQLRGEKHLPVAVFPHRLPEPSRNVHVIRSKAVGPHHYRQ